MSEAVSEPVSSLELSDQSPDVDKLDKEDTDDVAVLKVRFGCSCCLFAFGKWHGGAADGVDGPCGTECRSLKAFVHGKGGGRHVLQPSGGKMTRRVTVMFLEKHKFYGP